MLPASSRYDRTPVISITPPSATSATGCNARTAPFDTLPTEVVGRIFRSLPRGSMTHCDFYSRVCTRFAEVRRPYRLAASLYAGADLQQAQLSNDERVERVQKTLQGLAEHAGVLEDEHTSAILNRLIDGVRGLVGKKGVEAWRQMFEARRYLAKADQPDYMLKCLENPSSDTNEISQPDDFLDVFREVALASVDATAGKAEKLLSYLIGALGFLDQSIQLQAFGAVLDACANLHPGSRAQMLIASAKSIQTLDDTHHVKAAEAIRRMLPRLNADEVGPVQQSLLIQANA